MPAKRNSVEELRAIYLHRFENVETQRDKVWQVLARHYFQQWVQSTDAILDLGAGYCEFINNIQAKEKLALDLNPVTRLKASTDVKVISQDVSQTWPLESNTINVIFSSNFLEHLRTKEDLRHCLDEAYRVLRSGGLILLLGPNIRFCANLYWDFFDHHIPLSDRSIVEVLELAGFQKKKVIPRFLPYTMSGRRPPPPLLVRLYLAMPIAWQIMGKQFFVVASKRLGE
jgi:SAM-dependent methyltransferase